jgi:hypothetical protein
LKKISLGAETGPWENYDADNVSKNFLQVWNINDNNSTYCIVFYNSNADNLISKFNISGYCEIEELVLLLCHFKIVGMLY